MTRVGTWPSGNIPYLLPHQCGADLQLHQVLTVIWQQSRLLLFRDERSFSVCGILYRNEGAFHWLRIRSLR